MALGDATSTRLNSSLSGFRKKNKALTCALVAEQSRTSPESRGSTAALDRVPIGWEGRKRGEGGGEKTIGEKRRPRESAPEHSTKLFEALFRRNTPLPLKRLPRKPLTLCSSLASRDVPAPPLARPRRPAPSAAAAELDRRRRPSLVPQARATISERWPALLDLVDNGTLVAVAPRIIVGATATRNPSSSSSSRRCTSPGPRPAPRRGSSTPSSPDPKKQT